MTNRVYADLQDASESQAKGPSAATEALLIVTPVYNDWQSFARLAEDLEKAMPSPEASIRILAVDDCSTGVPIVPRLDGSILSIDVLQLSTNVGHQRAIATGLVQACKGPRQTIAVMDSDGEDSPEELRALVGMQADFPDQVIVASRHKRSEGLQFRLFYLAYRFVFRILTGQSINFGNFSVMSFENASRLIENPNIWNNVAATVVQSRIPLMRVPTVRSLRYHGQSHMNLVSLVTHGLGAISVFSEAVFVRILLVSMVMLAGSIAVAATVLGLRFFTTLAIPGWATTVLGFTLLASLQAVMFPILVTFLQLNGRSTFQSGPSKNADRLIAKIYRLYEKPA